jgi:hypothetical protein
LTYFKLIREAPDVFNSAIAGYVTVTVDELIAVHGLTVASGLTAREEERGGANAMDKWPIAITVDTSQFQKWYN